jgi:hypothetical protein
MSSEGVGGLIMTSPDPPTSLTEELSLRTKATLGFTWRGPLFSGGPDILDYKVSMADSEGNYQVVAENVASYEYMAENLTTGNTYYFKL